jgi:hypothetical protein
MESSSAVGSLEFSWRRRVSEYSMTVRVAVTSSPFILLDHKVRMESSSAVGSLEFSWRRRVSEYSMTVRVAVTSSPFIPRDHKVRDTLLVTSTSLL